MYKKTQFGLVSVVLIISVVGIIALTDIFSNHTIETPQLFILIAPLLVLLIMKDLTVTVDDETIQLVFGIGLIKREFAITDVLSCKRLENVFTLGWGIRYGPGFTLYNVSGRDSVELTFKDGRRKVRIGTGDLDGLYDAINSKIR